MATVLGFWMRKLFVFLITGILWCNISFADKLKNMHNFTFQLPDGFVLINKQTIDKLIVSAENKQLKDIYTLMKDDWLNDKTSVVFNKELITKGIFDNITVSSDTSTFAELKDVQNNEKAFCTVKLDWLVKLNGEDKIKSHQCALIDYPKGSVWSIQEFHQNLNNAMQNVYSVTFKISETSKKIQAVIITCGNYCDAYLPALNSIIGTAIIKNN